MLLFATVTVVNKIFQILISHKKFKTKFHLWFSLGKGQKLNAFMDRSYDHNVKIIVYVSVYFFTSILPLIDFQFSPQRDNITQNPAYTPKTFNPV